MSENEANAVRAEHDHRSYATVSDDGINYRDIAGTMTILGYPMNHSSARNKVLRIMRTFAHEITKCWDVVIKSDHRLDAIARSALFQNGIADVLRAMWDGPERAKLFSDDAPDEEEIKDHVDEPAAPAQHDSAAVHR